jgi:hypothetical protein
MTCVEARFVIFPFIKGDIEDGFHYLLFAQTFSQGISSSTGALSGMQVPVGLGKD